MSNDSLPSARSAIPPTPGSPTHEDPLIPLSEASRLGYGSAVTLRALIKDGVLPARQTRRDLKVLQSDLDKYVAVTVTPAGGGQLV